jgi:hypothetical protein
VKRARPCIVAVDGPAAMQQAMTDGAYAPLEELLAAPFRATVIRQLT